MKSKPAKVMKTLPSISVEEFDRQFQALQSTIFQGLLVYRVFQSLEPTEEFIGIWNMYKGFFYPVRMSLSGITILEFAKVFDEDPRTMSLINLLRHVSQEPLTYLPKAKEGDLTELQTAIAGLQEYSAAIAALKSLRDQRVAHNDANPDDGPPFLESEFGPLIKAIQRVYNAMSIAHDQSTYSWKRQLLQSSEDTAYILKVLQKDADPDVRLQKLMTGLTESSSQSNPRRASATQ